MAKKTLSKPTKLDIRPTYVSEVSVEQMREDMTRDSLKKKLIKTLKGRKI